MLEAASLASGLRIDGNTNLSSLFPSVLVNDRKFPAPAPRLFIVTTFHPLRRRVCRLSVESNPLL